ncbi:MAG: TIGR04086 family membrane protein [Tissierellia bacterium]|nr:TIGR04086 family membrane protein [Tissierellia bacterium]
MKGKVNLNYCFKGLGISFILTFILLLVVTLLLRFSSIREVHMSLMNNFVLTISIVLASAMVGRRVKEMGWLNGAVVGFLYYLVILLINLVFNRPFNFNLFLVFKLLTSTILGVIGGMIGINLS